MPDQIVDVVAAWALHADACRIWPVVGWVVMTNPVGYPGMTVARMVTDVPSPIVLVADTLAELRAKLPPRMVRTAPQPTDPPEAVEVWFST